MSLEHFKVWPTVVMSQSAHGVMSLCLLQADAVLVVGQSAPEVTAAVSANANWLTSSETGVFACEELWGRVLATCMHALASTPETSA